MAEITCIIARGIFHILSLQSQKIGDALPTAEIMGINVQFALGEFKRENRRKKNKSFSIKRLFYQFKTFRRMCKFHVLKIHRKALLHCCRYTYNYTQDSKFLLYLTLKRKDQLINNKRISNIKK